MTRNYCQDLPGELLGTVLVAARRIDVAPNQRFAAAMLNGAATAALFLVSHTSFLVTEAPRFVDGGHMTYK